MPLTMGLSMGQDDTVALRSKVRAHAAPDFLRGRVWEPPHLPCFLCPQMRCLTTPMLLRALAQAARTGRTRGAPCRSMQSQLHSITPLLAGHPSGRSLHSSAVAATYSESRVTGTSGFPDHGPARGRGGGLAFLGTFPLCTSVSAL